jgi:hypothetical protein
VNTVAPAISGTAKVGQTLESEHWPVVCVSVGAVHLLHRHLLQLGRHQRSEQPDLRAGRGRPGAAHPRRGHSDLLGGGRSVRPVRQG